MNSYEGEGGLQSDTCDDFYSLLDDKEFLYNRKKRRKGVRGRRPKNLYGLGQSSTPFLPKEVQQLMGRANMAFVNKELDKAIELYTEVIRTYPSSHEAYGVLGIIWDELGDKKKSLNYAVISAHLGGASCEVWRQCGIDFKNLYLFNEAIYCFTRAIKKNRKDIISIWERSTIFAGYKFHRRVVDSYYLLLKIVPFHPLVIRLLVHFSIVLGEPVKTIGYLEEMSLIDTYLSPPCATYRNYKHKLMFWHIRVLVRLYLHVGDFRRVNEALPTLVVWMRKLKRPSFDQCREEELVLSIPSSSDLLNYVNTLRSPIDNVFDPERQKDSILNDMADVESEEDARLDILDDCSVENNTVMDPSNNINEWFCYLPIDLKWHYMHSIIRMGTYTSAYVDSMKGDRFWSKIVIETGKAFIALNMFDEAIELFNTIIDTPDYVTSEERSFAFSFIAKCFNMKDMIDVSMEFYRKSLDMFEHNDDANLGLAELYHSIGEIELSKKYANVVDLERIKAPNVPEKESVQHGDTDRDGRMYSNYDFIERNFGFSVIFSDDAELEEDDGRYEEESIIIGSASNTDRKTKRQRNIADDIESISGIRSNLEEVHKRHFKMVEFEFPFEYDIEFLRYSEEECKRMRLLYKKANLLYEGDVYRAKKEDMYEFLETCGYLVSDFINNGYFYRESHKELIVFGKSSRIKKMVDGGCGNDPEISAISYAFAGHLQEIGGENSQALLQAAHGLMIEEWYSVVVRFALASVRGGLIDQAIYVLFKSISSNLFVDDKYKLNLYYLVLFAGRNRRHKAMGKMCRMLLFQFPEHPCMYGILSLFLSSGIEAKKAVSDGINLKFMLREVVTHPNSFHRLMMTGHSYSASRSYNDALKMYMRAYKVEESNPLILLTISVTYLNLSQQRVTTNRQFQILCGLVFMLKYHDVRGHSQDSYYNMGRYFDHIGLDRLSISNYERALSMDPEQGMRDLRFDIGHNLALVHYRLGNIVLYSYYLRKYCIL